MLVAKIFVLAIGVMGAAKDLKIAFWIDPVQKSIYEDIAKTLKDIEALHLEVEIHDSVLVVEPDNSDEQENMNKFCAILTTEGVSAVLDFTYNRWQQGYELLRTTGVPYIRIGRVLSPFLHAFGAFLQQKEADDVVMIFENLQARDEALYHIIEGYPFRTLLLSEADDTDLVKRIADLRPSPSYFGIFAHGSNMNNIFEKINKGKLFARPTEWHFVFLDTRDRAFKYRKQVEHATKFTVNAKALCKSLAMKDAYCTSGFTFQRAFLLEIFRQLIQLQQNGLSPHYVECNDTGPTTTTTTEQSQSNLVEQLEMSNFLLFTTNNLWDEDLENPPAVSYGVNISMNSYSNEHEAVTDLGVWQSGEFRKINETISPSKRFFRIGTIESIPWNFYRRDKRTGKIALDVSGKPIWEGFCIDLIHTLSIKLNFDYELIVPKRGDFGRRDPESGRWDGIVGDLVSGEIDFTISALKMYTDREEVIDFIAPYFEQTGISIVIRKPVRQTSLFKFMTVLRLEVWLSVVGALVATAVMLWLLDKYSPYSFHNNKSAYPYPCREFTLRESFWFALTSFTPQGGGEAPKAVSGRILVAAYWLFVVLMLATFTANLAAFLTVERMQTPVQSLEQLGRQSRINYTVVANSDVHKYFINMKFAEDTLYRMWKELALNASPDYHKFRVWDYPIKEQYGNILLAINGSNPVKDADEGFRKVNEHTNADFAFIHDSSQIKYELTMNCNLTEVGEVFGEQPYAIAVQQGSHLQDELSYAILELRKDRYFEDLKAKYWNQSRVQCPLSEDQEGITLESLGGVFIATLFGLGVAIVTLICEVLYYRQKRKAGNQHQSRITKVKPFLDEAPAPAPAPAPQPVERTWHTGLAWDKTPPPSFDAATFRGRQIPPTVTLGSAQFKPSRRLGLKSRKAPRGVHKSAQDAAPPYLE